MTEIFKGGIYSINSESIFENLSSGSIVKVLDSDSEAYKEYIGCYIIKIEEIEEYIGVTVYHPDNIDAGGLWSPGSIACIEFEIIKVV